MTDAAETPTHEFDADTRVERVAPTRWRAMLSDRWNIGPYLNGGYILAVALAAVHEALPQPDPLSVTAHYFSPPPPGPAEVEVEVVRVGRGHSTAQARLVQDGHERLRLLATFGDLSRASGPTAVHAEPPALPPPERCLRREPAEMPNGLVPEVARRFDVRVDPSTAGWMTGSPTGVGVIRGWTRFADGREPDVRSLPLIADTFPPAVFDVVSGGWVPTIELTVHVRGRPAPGWLRAQFTTRFLVDGYLEEDGEVWDSQGRPVALSRQLARINARR